MGTICLQCGDEGWDNAFVYCVQCLEFAVHRYCLDKIPETVDEFVDWECDNCEGPSNKMHHVAQVQTRDTSKAEDTERACGAEDKDVITVRAEQIPGNIFEQPRDSVDAIESNVGSPCSPLAGEERKREKTCEILGKEMSSEDILLKDIAKKQKKKRRLRERGDEKDHNIPGSDKSDKKSRKRRKDVDTPYRAAVLSPTVTQISDRGDEKRVPEKSYESADGSEKSKTGPSNKVVLQEERILKGTASPIQHDVVPGEDFLEDSENRTPQPIAIPIWRGGFCISNEDRNIEGLVAHLSDRACEKVYATACGFQPVIDFEMNPKSRVWPKSFEKAEPNGESIALYFFASETSANVFDRLVEDMVEKELALKAVLGDAELLIFTSTELPVKYWRFQSKFYLWGVFRGKQRSSSQRTPG